MRDVGRLAQGREDQREARERSKALGDGRRARGEGGGRCLAL